MYRDTEQELYTVYCRAFYMLDVSVITTYTHTGMYRVGRVVPRHIGWLLRCSSTSVTAEPFLNGSSSSYVEAMYESWQKDPSSVHKVS